MWKKPRAWSDPGGCSSTIVLFDPGGRSVDDEPMVFMLTNLGWIGPVELDLDENETVEQAAEQIAKGYELAETDRDKAIWLTNCEGQEELFEM
jgi:hypothetical protein